MVQLLATPLLPVPFVILTSAGGVLCLVVFRRYRIGRALCGGSLVLLLLFSWQPFGAWLIRPLEQQYAPLLDPQEAADANYVLVLGGGHSTDASLPVSARVEEMPMVRLAEGVRLHRALPETTLVTSGRGAEPTMARTKAEMARAWGVEDVRVHDEPHNTAAEAQAARRAFGDDPFILVTSASHMPRAMALFRSAGLDPIPAPTQHMAPAIPPEDWWSVRYLRPSATGLRMTERAVYEYLGLAWGWLKGDLQWRGVGRSDE
ncbi:MAG: envelope biogenesis factor ElyC [Spiribacter salinus]|uniref:Envelope biogenesis factor ElyC n=1 Tax=Spiribacter salinus TaxID=1335746 RepID=A0A540VRR3_9GAMM|nr:MAG: envelope biogenesis factor ElyC [Spiribacter salinus]